MLPYWIGFVYQLGNVILYLLSEYRLKVISVHLYKKKDITLRKFYKALNKFAVQGSLLSFPLVTVENLAYHLMSSLSGILINATLSPQTDVRGSYDASFERRCYFP